MTKIESSLHGWQFFEDPLRKALRNGLTGLKAYVDYRFAGDYTQTFEIRIPAGTDLGANQDERWMYTGTKLSRGTTEIYIGCSPVPPVRTSVIVFRDGHSGCSEGTWVLRVSHPVNVSRRAYILKKAFGRFLPAD